jgi:hypothetical protein
MQLALQAASDSVIHPVVVWAEEGPFSRFADARALRDEPRARPVWGVIMQGRFVGECPAPVAACPHAATKLVVLDFLTGDFLFSEAPAPSRIGIP